MDNYEQMEELSRMSEEEVYKALDQQKKNVCALDVQHTMIAWVRNIRYFFAFFVDQDVKLIKYNFYAQIAQ